MNNYELNYYQKLVSPYRRKLFSGIFLIFFAIMTGVLGFHYLENHSFLEAFYMTIITLSTVGFGEVRPLSDAGRVFVSILILLNLGIFTYAISTLTSLLINKELTNILKYRTLLKKIKALKNHTIVCGYGRHGRQAISHLQNIHQPFVVVENNPEKINDLLQKEILFLQGDAADDDLLRLAGIEKAQALLVTISDEAQSVYVVLSARQLNANLNIISRAANEKSEAKLKRAGANHVLMPEKISGFYMATLIVNPKIVEFLRLLSNMGNTTILFEEVPVNDLRPTLRNKTLATLNIYEKTGANLIGIRLADGNFLINPEPIFQLQSGMELIILGNETHITSFRDTYCIAT